MNHGEWRDLLETLDTGTPPSGDVLTDAQIDLVFRVALSGQVASTWGLLTQLLIKAGSPTIDALATSKDDLGEEVDASSRSFAKAVLVPYLADSSAAVRQSDDPYVSNPLRKPRLTAEGDLEELVQLLEQCNQKPELAAPMLSAALYFLRNALAETLDRGIRLQAQKGVLDQDLWSSERYFVVSTAGPAAISALEPSVYPKGRSGVGTEAEIPWFAAFIDSNSSATEGCYPVYLFDAVGDAVFLCLNLGTENRSLGEIQTDVGLKRELLGERIEKFSDAPDLRSSQSGSSRPRKYELGSVACIRYEDPAEVGQAQLAKDLHEMVELAQLTLVGLQPVDTGSISDVVDQFSIALEKANINYGTRHNELVRRFIASLATKRFLILTGLSGSGKTRLAQAFGEWLGEEQHLVVPVRPDWTSPDYLLGYVNELAETSEDGRKAWAVPETLEFMLRAENDTGRPYLLILDEMNLAHVERYFADVLSGIESDKSILPNLVKDVDGWFAKDGARLIELPKNLFVVGTVNVDETTYMFSPKVLDRANTIEFRVETDDLGGTTERPVSLTPGDEGLVARFLADALLLITIDNEGEIAERLRTLHAVLSKSGREFGHRTFAEVLEFAHHYSAAGGAGDGSAFDIQVYQKVLPRLHGSKRDIGPVLEELLTLCGPPKDSPDDLAALPLSYDKLSRMKERLERNHFVSFAE